MGSNTFKLVLSAVVLSAVALSFGVSLDDFEERTQGTTPYRLFKPKNYDASKSYPLCFFLHGGGERGSDNSLQITGQPAGPYCFAREEVQDVGYW